MGGKHVGRPDSIMSCSTSECPVSIITPESIRLVEDFVSAQSVHRTFGASPYGADSNKWPAFWHDAVAVLSAAQSEADSIERGL
jgi:hypothetical protein